MNWDRYSFETLWRTHYLFRLSESICLLLFIGNLFNSLTTLQLAHHMLFRKGKRKNNQKENWLTQSGWLWLHIIQKAAEYRRQRYLILTLLCMHFGRLCDAINMMNKKKKKRNMATTTCSVWDRMERNETRKSMHGRDEDTVWSETETESENEMEVRDASMSTRKKTIFLVLYAFSLSVGCDFFIFSHALAISLSLSLSFSRTHWEFISWLLLFSFQIKNFLP